MCGIAGIVGPKSDRYQPALKAMTHALRHRGPDGSGHYAFPNCALGHTRLSIVDLEGGDQPLLTYDRSLGISFNGEIYGYQQLTQHLKNRGYVFQTKSDTEVILALYRQYGECLVEHLPGMFAFAIWDEKQQKLFCARDRFGEKPLFYAQTTAGDLIFASEIKAILASGLIEPVLSNEALCYYIKYGYIHPTLSIYSNIHPLPPAHCFIFQDGKIGPVRRYWDLPATQVDIGLAEATEQFSELLQQAVERQLVADVEVSAFLSGGLDSSTLVCLAHAINPKIKTFTFGFQGLVNEFPYARAMAEMYHTDHYELEEAEANMAGTLSKILVEPLLGFDGRNARPPSLAKSLHLSFGGTGVLPTQTQSLGARNVQHRLPPLAQPSVCSQKHPSLCYHFAGKRSAKEYPHHENTQKFGVR